MLGLTCGAQLRLGPHAALVLGVELGANDAPTDELARRVTAAAEVYHRGACAKLVLCGGKLPGHRLAEADVMARMMTALGVSASYARLLADYFAPVRLGLTARVTDAVPQMTGHPARRLAAWVEENAGALAA